MTSTIWRLRYALASRLTGRADLRALVARAELDDRFDAALAEWNALSQHAEERVASMRPGPFELPARADVPWSIVPATDPQWQGCVPPVMAAIPMSRRLLELAA